MDGVCKEWSTDNRPSQRTMEGCASIICRQEGAPMVGLLYVHDSKEGQIFTEEVGVDQHQLFKTVSDILTTPGRSKLRD